MRLIRGKSFQQSKGEQTLRVSHDLITNTTCKHSSNQSRLCWPPLNLLSVRSKVVTRHRWHACVKLIVSWQRARFGRQSARRGASLSGNRRPSRHRIGNEWPSAARHNPLY